MLSFSLPCRSEITQRLRALRARLRLAGKPESVLCALDRKPTLIIYVLSNYEKTPTVFFVERARALRRLPFVPADQIMAAVEHEFVTAGLDELNELLDMRYPSAALDLANQVLVEWEVVRWVSEQNACGVAPSTAEMLSKFVCLPPSGAARTSTGKPAKTARMWASRWGGVPCELLFFKCVVQCSFRARWKGHIGRVRIVEEVDEPAFRNQACCSLRGGVFWHRYLNRAFDFLFNTWRAGAKCSTAR